MGSPGGFMLPALFTTAVELVAVVTGVSSESHCVRAGQRPKVQHGREV